MATEPALSCQDADLLMRESRNFFNDYIVEKMAINSIYYGRIETQEWPTATQPEMTAFRLNRGWYDPTLPWKRVVSGRCEQNSCEADVEKIARPGSEAYTFSQMTKDMKTNWFCLTDLTLYRLFGQKELEHFWDTMAVITANVHEEFTRTNFVANSGHKWATVAADDSLISCEPISDTMWVMREFEGSDTGFDSRYIYVKIDPANIGNIGLLSIDNLDDALIDLQRTDDAYRLDVSELAGEPMLEIIVPDARVPRKMWEQAKQSNGWWQSVAGFDDRMRQAALGIRRVIGNYAFSYDVNALKYDVDWTYNASLGAFSEDDIDTWPRLVRVLPYYPVASDLGCEWKINQRYNRADFGITTAWVNNQLIKWVPPGSISAGPATAPVQNFAGEWQWLNPEWECNYKRNQGFFWNQFRMAMQVQYPDMLHSFLHRLDNSRLIPGACCDLSTNYYSPAQIDCFSCPVEYLNQV